MYLPQLLQPVPDLLQSLHQGYNLHLRTDPTERLLLDFLQSDPRHIDDLTNESGLPASTVSAVLTMMDLKGMVRHLGGMQYAAR